MNSQLTGNTRYRLQQRWFSRPILVLMVEFEHGDGPSIYCGQMPSYLAGVAWRDASVIDLQTLHAMDKEDGELCKD